LYVDFERRGTIPLEVIVTVLTVLPLLAAGLLALFALVLRPLRVIPAQEYEQLTRVPAWLTVTIGCSIVCLAIIAISQMLPRGAQVFIGFPGHKAIFMVDGFTLWASAILGMVFATAAWVPAARRCLIPRAFPLFFMTLILAWFSLLALFSIQLGTLYINWLFLLAGMIVLWTLLLRPGWRWEQLEVMIILALFGVLGSIGFIWLHALVQGSDITNMWSVLLASSPRATNSAMLFVIIGCLGPAVYLPWWLWTRRSDEAAVWFPSAMLVMVTGVLVLIRLLFFLFPAGGGDFAQLPGVSTFSWSSAC
jgi:hypothetical protein